MENKVRYVTLTAIIAVAAGLAGAFGVAGITAETYANNSAVVGAIMGHIAYTHTDADGNIIGYQQTDNIIVNEGENMVLHRIFGEQGVNSLGVEEDDVDGFRVIGLGNGTSTTAVETDTGLVNEIDATAAGCGMQRVEVTSPTFTASSGTGTQAVAVISNQFTNGCGTYEISESGLFNSTAVEDNGMFARQAFSNNVTLANGESLTVEWTINVGGTASFP